MILLRSASSLRSLWGLFWGISCFGSMAIANNSKVLEVGFVDLGVSRERDDEREDEKERSGLHKGLKGEQSSMVQRERERD